MNTHGIYLDPPFIQISTLQKKGKTITIKAQTLTTLQSFQWDKKKFKGKIASGLSSKDFLLQSIDFKLKNHRHLEEALAFRAESMSYFPSGEVITASVIDAKKETKSLLFTTPKDLLQEHLFLLEKLQIDPDIITTAAIGLCQFAKWKIPSLNTAFLIDIGSHEIHCIFMEEGKLKKAYILEKGVESLLAALLEDRKKILLKKEIESAAKQLDLLLLKPSLKANLNALLNEMKLELSKIFFACAPKDQHPILFTGRVDAFIHLEECLVERPIASISLEEKKFAMSIGIALEATRSNPLQLRRNEFFPKKNWRKMGMFALVILTASMLLSLTLYQFVTESHQARKIKMMNSLGLDYKEDMEGQIEHWISTIEKNNQDFPYISKAPKVTEVLSWLSNHPLLLELKSQNDPIDIQDIRYQLITFPTIDSPKTAYLAKVQLDFHFQNATSARRFHESLRAGDFLVNPDLEITWDVRNDCYNTSFFLKNRSHHVF